MPLKHMAAAMLLFDLEYNTTPHAAGAVGKVAARVRGAEDVTVGVDGKAVVRGLPSVGQATEAIKNVLPKRPVRFGNKFEDNATALENTARRAALVVGAPAEKDRTIEVSGCIDIESVGGMQSILATGGTAQGELMDQGFLETTTRLGRKLEDGAVPQAAILRHTVKVTCLIHHEAVGGEEAGAVNLKAKQRAFPPVAAGRGCELEDGAASGWRADGLA